MLEERVAYLSRILHNGFQDAQTNLDHFWISGWRKCKIQENFFCSELVEVLNIRLSPFRQRSNDDGNIKTKMQRFVFILQKTYQPGNETLLDDESLLSVGPNDKVLDLCGCIEAFCFIF